MVGNNNMLWKRVNKNMVDEMERVKYAYGGRRAENKI
jgi:hypothetical protein